MPTYYLVLGWVVATASPLYGTVLMASYGLGRVVPALGIGALLAGGASRKAVSRRMALVQQRVEAPLALVMAAVGAYLLVFFGVVVGLRAL
jgi:cytochrome c biogenesis protein CcdA